MSQNTYAQTKSEQGKKCISKMSDFQEVSDKHINTKVKMFLNPHIRIFYFTWR